MARSPKRVASFTGRFLDGIVGRRTADGGRRTVDGRRRMADGQISIYHLLSRMDAGAEASSIRYRRTLLRTHVRTGKVGRRRRSSHTAAHLTRWVSYINPHGTVRDSHDEARSLLTSFSSVRVSCIQRRTSERRNDMRVYKRLEGRSHLGRPSARARWTDS